MSNRHNQKVGAVKFYRSIRDSWVSERPEWFQAWSFALLEADYETEVVDLTAVRKSLPSDAFTDKAWRYFVQKLEVDGMIRDVKTTRLGRGKGSRMVADISGYLRAEEARDDS